MSAHAVAEALGKAGYDRATLYVHPVNVGAGHEVASRFNLNLALHDGEFCEWYVEWQGRKVGSIGI